MSQVCQVGVGRPAFGDNVCRSHPRTKRRSRGVRF